MDAYRLYTVVPVLVKFIDNLTNIYVRYNRRRLKGSKGVEDTLMALVSLYDVLLTVCKVSSSSCPLNDDQMTTLSLERTHNCMLTLYSYHVVSC